MGTPSFCPLYITDHRARHKRPCTELDAGKGRSRLEIHLWERLRGRQLHLLHVHAMLLHLCSLLMPLATVVVHTTFQTTILHHSHHHLVIAQAVHDGSTHTHVNHHEREQENHHYVERTFHGRKINTFLSDNFQTSLKYKII